MTEPQLQSPVELLRDALRQLPSWALDVGLAVVLLLIVLVSDMPSTRIGWFPISLLVLVCIAVPTALAVASARVLPGVALGLVWLSSMFQVIALNDLFPAAQLAVPIVAYGVARYGSQVVVALGWVSAVAAVGLGTVYLRWIDSWLQFESMVFDPSTGQTLVFGQDWLVALTLAVPLVVPLTVGMAVRFLRQKHDAERRRVIAQDEAEEAHELAGLKAAHAGLARDVHDIVGHSLAVIIAQADSIDYIPDSDVEMIRQATGNISATARQSLLDVRDVLSRTAGGHDGSPVHEVQVSELIESVRNSGRQVEVHSHGTAHTVSPEVGAAAHRVMQEMLTNALRHSVPDSPIRLTRAWTHRTYTITVENSFDPVGLPVASGRGVTGMRERLTEIGGTLSPEIQPGETDGTFSFTISAVIPLYLGKEPA